jgi:hypothetical protein
MECLPLLGVVYSVANRDDPLILKGRTDDWRAQTLLDFALMPAGHFLLEEQILGHGRPKKSAICPMAALIFLTAAAGAGLITIRLLGMRVFWSLLVD